MDCVPYFRFGILAKKKLVFLCLPYNEKELDEGLYVRTLEVVLDLEELTEYGLNSQISYV